jgi:hypothetical protein
MLAQHSRSNGSNGRKAPRSGEVRRPAPSADAETSPSANGVSGPHSNGQSVTGDPRNPFARQVAALRQAALDAVSPDDIRAILAKMVTHARLGDISAAKLVLAYAIGKPQPAPNPDRVDVDEWEHFKATAPMISEVACQGLMTPDPIVPLTSLRFGRDAMTKQCATLFQAMADEPQRPLRSLLGMLKRDKVTR